MIINPYYSLPNEKTEKNPLKSSGIHFVALYPKFKEWFNIMPQKYQVIENLFTK